MVHGHQKRNQNYEKKNMFPSISSIACFFCWVKWCFILQISSYRYIKKKKQEMDLKKVKSAFSDEGGTRQEPSNFNWARNFNTFDITDTRFLVPKSVAKSNLASAPSPPLQIT